MMFDRKNYWQGLTLILLSGLFCSPLCGQDTNPDGVLLYRAKGTGQTTGHIITLSVFNRSSDSVSIQIGPCLIPATGKYQGYVVNRIYEVMVPPIGHTDVALSGYCTNVFKPAVPEGARMAAFEDWVSLEESAPVPWGDRPPGQGFIPLSGTSVDSIWLTYPGTSVPFLYKIDFDEYSASAAAMLIKVVNDIERKVAALKPLLRVGDHGDETQEQTIVQQVFWQYTARLSGGIYPFVYFKERLKEQVMVSTKEPAGVFSEQRWEEIMEVSLDLWSTFELVAGEAKLVTRAGKKETWSSYYQEWIRSRVNDLRPNTPDALGKWWRLQDSLSIIERYLDRENIEYARWILKNSSYEVMKESIRSLDENDPAFLSQWMITKAATEKLTDAELATEYLSEEQKVDIHTQLQEKLNPFLQNKLDQLDPDAVDFLQQLKELENLFESQSLEEYIESTARRQAKERLAEKMKVYFETQFRQLEKSDSVRINQWLDLVFLAQTDWSWEYLEKSYRDEFLKRLEEILQADLREQANQLDPGDNEMVQHWLDLIMLMQVDWVSDYAEGVRKQIEEMLSNKLMEHVNRRIDQLDEADPKMFQKWLELIWLMQVDFVYDYLEGEQRNIDQQLEQKIKSFFTEQIKRLDAKDPDFMPQWAELERTLSDDWMPNYLNEEEIKTLKDQLSEQLKAALWHQTQQLNPNNRDFIRHWRMIHELTKTDWFEEYLAEGDQTKMVKTLEKNYRQWEKSESKTTETAKVDWGEVQLNQSSFKIPIIIPKPFPVWIPIAGGTVATGGIILLTSGDGNSTPDLPMARDDTATASCNSQASVNVLANDSGGGLEISNIIIAPGGAEVSQTGNGNLQISNIGSTSFSFTYTITDQNGQKTTATVTVTVTDDSPPAITCPADITIDCTNNTTPSITGQASASDNCDSSPTVTYTDVNSGLDCEQPIIRTWAASDLSGNTSNCVQTITLVDEQTPVINCPASVDVDLDGDISPAITGRASATDNCSLPEAIALNFTDVTGGLTGCAGTGNILRTWSAADECGNNITCTQEISIVDNQPPQIVCPFPAVVSSLNEIDPTVTGQATAVDNASTIDNITLVYEDNVDGLDGCGGIVQRLWIATDICGNVSNCTQDIIIEDTEPPVISCPATVEVSCNEIQDVSITGQPTATDNYTNNSELVISFTDNQDELTPCGGGDLIRFWTAADVCVNTSSCEQVIRVQADVQEPALNCPMDIIVDCGQQNNIGLTGAATALDNCSADITLDFSDDQSNLIGCEGFIIRTWTAIDPCGNNAACEQTININPVGGCTLDLFLQSTVNPSSSTSTDGSLSMLVFNIEVSLPVNIFLNEELLFSSEGFEFTIPELAAGSYEVYVTDQNGCISTTARVDLVAPGGIQYAQSLRNTFVTFPMISLSPQIQSGLDLHQYYSNHQLLFQQLPEHPTLESAPDFDYYFGPSVRVSMGYSLSQTSLVGLNLLQYGAIGVSNWMAPDASGQVVFLQSPFQSRVMTLRYQQFLAKGRLQPVVGIGAQIHQLFFGNSVLQQGNQRLVLPDARRLQVSNLLVSGGLQFRLRPNVVFRLDGGAVLKPGDFKNHFNNRNMDKRFSLHQEIGVELGLR